MTAPRPEPPTHTQAEPPTHTQAEPSTHTQAEPSVQLSEAAAFSPGRGFGVSRRGHVDEGRGRAGSADDLRAVGLGEGEGLLRAPSSPETRRRRRAWRRHTVVVTPTEPVAPGNKVAVPMPRPLEVSHPPQMSRFHEFL
ncbi:rho GTPase-activating protein 23-like [Alosa alosa]|uniref:rho GTPase-activating protein 23-like n=1 Tax=Alosa alosa TaxID=278164 RepID=UPI00201518AD|nr:rho GTPase-activating protein 23-like [Alosa alosa]